ncbi:ABC transporter [Hassallia byssoidea VB512170]|uniref:ABC transporter n=1 Tax=Hassallia byssoidea VB512170 TaxID=1304833 RepID=A0A846H1V5_9CYAN|nr:Gldg family protein [Hassalia byssoidea]NEU71512.1 ABC transporter [Hassalia byssoidea VB512170]
MKNIAKRRLWKYLFWFGPFLLVAGLTAGLVSQKWGVIPLAFLIPGIVIIGFWLIWQTQRTNWWGRRSTQAGTNALVATLAVLAILGLINFIGTRYHLRTDLTDTQLFTLAPQSRELVQSLQKPAKVWVFDVNRNPQDLELLENYRRLSSKFKFEFVDPQARPGLADKFGVKDYGEVYLESENKRQLVQMVNQNERLSEIRLTNRLQQITSTTTAKVYLLQGHGERQLAAGEGAISQAVQALSDKNFTTSALNLAEKSAVPDDAAVVIVAGAKKALFDNEVKALQTYLNRGGNLLLAIDPNTDPKLNSLLQQWGVRLDNRLAVDVSNNVGIGPAVALVTEYGQHPITKDFGNGISLYPLARPLEVTPVPGVESTTLIVTKPYPSSWAESDLQSENLQFNQGSDRKGPLTLGVALKRKLSAKPQPQPTPTPNPSPLPSPTTQSKASPSPTPPLPPSPTTELSPTSTESRLVVLGNSDFATDGLFQQQLNGDVFLNSVTWLSQQDQQPLSIRPKEVKNRRINITGTQANLLALSSLVILPLIGLAGAAVLWWKRR